MQTFVHHCRLDSMFKDRLSSAVLIRVQVQVHLIHTDVVTIKYSKITKKIKEKELHNKYEMTFNEKKEKCVVAKGSKATYLI